MKNFQDNIDKMAIDQTRVNRFTLSSSSSRTVVQRVWRWLSRYSLLVVVGLAALSITILHLQGRSLLQAIFATPLPVFWLDGLTEPEPLPNKTDIYTASLAQEAAQRRVSPIAPPAWGGQYHTAERKDTTTFETTIMDTIQSVAAPKKNWSTKRHSNREKPKIDSSTSKSSAPSSLLFHTLRAEQSEPVTRFISCLIHGDQEINQPTRVVLRLTEAMKIKGKTVPAGTLIYGLARLSQNRVQVTIARIGSVSVSYQVYDHTYHPDIWLDQGDNQHSVSDAAQDELYRQGQQQVSKIPVPMLPQVSRSLLQRRRRNTSSVLLPDGYPVYIASISSNN
uniref:Conjugative transposon protein TraM n=1 Tax=Roseihalotalea indica TaxID=2867963 RepID=A0AA49GLK1_9BACT|nr:conjugative transposon protein TraM [Tunicatimonas sp. TK19036]